MEGMAHHYNHHYYRNHRLLRRVRIPPSPYLSGHQRRRGNPESEPPARLGSVIRDLSLRRVSQAKTSNINARFQDPRFSFPFLNLNSWKHMATKNDGPKAEDLGKKKERPDEEDEEEESKREAKEKSPPPPPPEMPEPGDCCGSGCVRCVWDVYYEELEAYNKLYLADSDPSNSRPS